MASVPDIVKEPTYKNTFTLSLENVLKMLGFLGFFGIFWDFSGFFGINPKNPECESLDSSLKLCDSGQAKTKISFNFFLSKSSDLAEIIFAD